MAVQHKTALVSDFDGTISDDDFFYYISRQYLGEKSLVPWQAYMEGKKTHFEALKEIFASLRVEKADLDNFIRKIRIDKGFLKTAAWCQEQQIPVYVCSAGCDYYINLLIGPAIAEYGIRLVANHGTYSSNHGLEMTPPPAGSRFYDFGTGINKAAIVAYLQEQGYRVVYCGDGMPDLAAARIADWVFARKMLLLQCIDLGIPAVKLIDFEQVYCFLEGKNNEKTSALSNR